jgi:hypothetical protein
MGEFLHADTGIYLISVPRCVVQIIGLGGLEEREDENQLPRSMSTAAARSHQLLARTSYKRKLLKEILLSLILVTLAMLIILIVFVVLVIK